MSNKNKRTKVMSFQEEISGKHGRYKERIDEALEIFKGELSNYPLASGHLARFELRLSLGVSVQSNEGFLNEFPKALDNATLDNAEKLRDPFESFKKTIIHNYYQYVRTMQCEPVKLLVDGKHKITITTIFELADLLANGYAEDKFTKYPTSHVPEAFDYDTKCYSVKRYDPDKNYSCEIMLIPKEKLGKCLFLYSGSDVLAIFEPVGKLEPDSVVMIEEMSVAIVTHKSNCSTETCISLFWLPDMNAYIGFLNYTNPAAAIVKNVRYTAPK